MFHFAANSFTPLSVRPATDTISTPSIFCSAFT